MNLKAFKIKKLLVLCGILLLFTNGSCKDENKNEESDDKNEAELELVWSDEFDYEGYPDPSKWNYEVGFIRNQEPQYYTKNRLSNAEVKDGNLVITARKEKYNGAEYTSASINTYNKFHFTNGRVEVRAKIPRGKGVWPAIWTLGTNVREVDWPLCGEIDILEYWGENPNSIHANVHTDDYNHSKDNGRGGELIYSQPWQEFHIYAVEWHDDKLDFYMNDFMYYSCERKGEGIGEWPFVDPQYLLLNLALQKGENKIDDSIFPAKYIIDYVRIYSF